jgi:hypothetical protein
MLTIDVIILSFSWFSVIAEHIYLSSEKCILVLIHSVCRCALMEKPSKLRLLMALLPAISVFTRKEVKPARTALLQSLLGQEDLHTGITSSCLSPSIA